MFTIVSLGVIGLLGLVAVILFRKPKNWADAVLIILTTSIMFAGFGTAALRQIEGEQHSLKVALFIAGVFMQSAFFVWFVWWGLRTIFAIGERKMK